MYSDISDHIESGARPVDIHCLSKDIEDPNFEIRQKTGFLTKRGDRIKVRFRYFSDAIKTVR